MNLRELSDLLGLSQTTVSRALNGYPEVNEETRHRVQAAANTHGYRPNSRARGLATGRALAIGHVIPVSTQHEMVNPVFADFIAGAGEVYSSAGYDILLKIVPDDQEEAAYRDMAAQQSVDGVIIHGPRVDDPRIKLLSEIGLPFVVHGRSTEARQDYTCVDVDNRRAFERATDLLLDLGHSRIALINGLETMDFAQRRRKGYLQALESRGHTPLPDHLASGEMTEGLGYQTAQAMLASAQAPTAFLVSSLIVALGVRRAIEDQGLVLGTDVSVVTHDDMLGYLPNGDPKGTPVFTATRSSVREAGQTAARMLLHRIKHPASPHQTDLLEAQLTLGGSTRPVRHAPPAAQPQTAKA